MIMTNYLIVHFFTTRDNNKSNSVFFIVKMWSKNMKNGFEIRQVYNYRMYLLFENLLNIHGVLVE